MANAKKEATTTNKESEGTVDKIRELLFGAQMENYEQHFQRLETLLAAETRRTMEDLLGRLMATEAALNQRIEKAEQNQERERKERILAFNTVNETLQKAFLQLKERLDAFEKTTGQNVADLRDSIEHESHSLGSQIKALRDEFTLSLKDDTTRLDRQKVNRQQLADLLLGISNELNRS
jgi:hypothetical protein